VDAEALHAGRLRVEESCGLHVGVQPRAKLRRKRLRARFEGIDARAILGAARERGATRRVHPALGLEPRHVPEVHLAPDTGRLPRREAPEEAVLVEGVQDTVDPPEAEGLVERRRVADAAVGRVHLEEADPQLKDAVVVLLEPAPEFGRCAEALRLRRRSRARHGR